MAGAIQDSFPTSPAYRELQPLRIPAGWRVGWNELRATMADDLSGIGGSSLFSATNEGRRFNIDIEFRPEFDPDGAFHLLVQYQPWQRTEHGRRRTEMPFAFNADAQEVHRSHTRNYAELIERLEYWIARCTVWALEEN